MNKQEFELQVFAGFVHNLSYERQALYQEFQDEYIDGYSTKYDYDEFLERFIFKGLADYLGDIWEQDLNKSNFELLTKSNVENDTNGSNEEWLSEDFIYQITNSPMENFALFQIRRASETESLGCLRVNLAGRPIQYSTYFYTSIAWVIADFVLQQIQLWEEVPSRRQIALQLLRLPEYTADISRTVKEIFQEILGSDLDSGIISAIVFSDTIGKSQLCIGDEISPSSGKELQESLLNFVSRTDNNGKRELIKHINSYLPEGRRVFEFKLHKTENFYFLTVLHGNYRDLVTYENRYLHKYDFSHILSIILTLIVENTNENLLGFVNLRSVESIIPRVFREIVTRRVLRYLFSKLKEQHDEARIGDYDSSLIVTRIEKISTLTYELSRARGALLFYSTNNPLVLYICKFRKPEDLSKGKNIRKLLQGLGDNQFLLCEHGMAHGIGQIAEEASEQRDDYHFAVKFFGNGKWSVTSPGYNDQAILNVDNGQAYLYRDKSIVNSFESTFGNIFPELIQFTREWKLIINRIISLSSGALIVISSEAETESQRLAENSYKLHPFRATQESLPFLTRIDGAILLEPNLTCHAFGVILDGPPCENDDSSRGSRYNSAVRYKFSRREERNIVIVISVDGAIDIINT